MPAITAINTRVSSRLLTLWFPVFLCMGTIFYFSSLSSDYIPALFSYEDIVFHLCIYLILGFTFSRAIKETKQITAHARVLLLTVIFCFLYGISDELHQAFVPGRSVSGTDLFIDSAGSFFGSMFYIWLK